MKMSVEQYRKLQKQSEGKLNRLVTNRTGNKLNAKGQYYKGQFYHSTGEMNYAQQLDIRMMAGEIKDWKRQVKIELKVNGITISCYFMDFVVTHVDKTLEYIEYKGYPTEYWRLKFKLLEALKEELIPGAKLTVVKHKAKYKFKPK